MRPTVSWNTTAPAWNRVDRYQLGQQACYRVHSTSEGKNFFIGESQKKSAGILHGWNRLLFVGQDQKLVFAFSYLEATT